MNRKSIVTIAVAVVTTILVVLWLGHAPNEDAAGRPAISPSEPETAGQASRPNGPDQLPFATTPPVETWRERLTALNPQISDVFGRGHDELRMNPLQAFVETLTADEAAAVLKEIQDWEPSRVRQDLEMRLIRWWADGDPQAAADWAAANTEGGEIIAFASEKLARRSLPDAIEWAKQLPDTDDRITALKGITGEVVYTQPVQALELAALLPADAERDDFVTRACEAWTMNSPEEAVSWVKQIPDPELRRQVIASVAGVWGDSDPVAAANFAIESLPEGRDLNGAIVTIVRAWATKDAPAATQWVQQFPEGELRNEAVQSLAEAAERLKMGRPREGQLSQ